MEFVNVNINKKLYEKLKYLSEQRKKEIKQRKNAGTIYPIYIVQEKYETVVDTQFEDYDQEVLYTYTDSELTKYYSIEDLLKFLEEKNINKDLIKDIRENVKEFEYIPEIIIRTGLFDAVYHVFVNIEYKDKAYFLTREEAEDYIKRQYYNLKDPKIYVNFPGYSNYSSFEEILNLLDNENIFVETIFLDELNVQSQHDYLEEKYSQLSDNKLKPIYLCAICDNEITSDESGIYSGCREHEEYKRGEYENRERIIIK